MQHEPETKMCAACGLPFYRKQKYCTPSRQKQWEEQKYCSTKCGSASNGRSSIVDLTEEQRRQLHLIRAMGKGGKMDTMKISKMLRAAGHAVSERMVRRELGLKPPGK